MANQYFSIKEQVFDIEFSNRSLAYELQNRISRFSNHRLTHLMNDSFEKLVPENSFIRLDTVTLDIGSVSYDRLEEELETKLIASLEEQLLQQIILLRENRSEQGNARIEDISGDESLLEFFLLQGTLPWWVHKNADFDLEEIIARLFSDNPSSLRALLVRVGHNENVRKRLVYQFSEKSIRRFITVLEPSESEYIFSYHKEVVAIQKNEQVVQAETAVFEKAVWLFILTYLLDERGSEFSRRTFVKSSLRQMAASFNISYSVLLDLFYQAVIRHSSDEKKLSSFEIMITQLVTEEEAASEGSIVYAADEPATDIYNPLQLAEKAELIRYYFRYGTLPVGIGLSYKESLAKLLAELSVQIPVTLQQILTNLSSEKTFAERYVQITGQEGGKEILYRLFPGVARLLLTFASVTELVNRKKNLIKIDNGVLKADLFQLAIQHIFSSSGRDLGDVKLLETMVDSIAGKYQLDKKQWITAIYQSVQQEFRQGIIHSTLPETIGQLFEQIQVSTHDELPRQTETIDVLEETELPATHQINKLNVLTYLIQHGHIPWWGKHFFANTVAEDLLKQLLTEAPQQIIQLIRFAGADTRRQKRLLSMAGISTWIDMLSLLPEGKQATTIVQQALRFTKGIQADEAVVARTVLQAIWDQLVMYGYHSFSVPGFYIQIINRLADTTGKPSAAIAQFIADAVDTSADKIPGDVYRLKEIISGIATQLQKQERLVSSEQLLGYLHAQLPRVVTLELLAALRPYEQEYAFQKLLADIAESGKQLINKELTALVRYYLTWGRLPGIISSGKEGENSLFIRQLFYMLLLSDPGSLTTIIKQHALNETVLMELVGLFDSNKGGSEKQLQELFENARTINKKTIPEKKAAKKITVDKGLLKEYKANIYAVVSHGKVMRDEVMDTTLSAALAYFLQWNRLPDQWRRPDGVSQAAMIRQIVFILFQENRQALHQLLQQTWQHVPARLFMHDLFSESAGGIEKEIALFLQPFKERYLHTEITSVALSQIETITEPEAFGEQTDMSAAQLSGLIEKFLTDGQLAAPLDTELKLAGAVIQLYSIDRKSLERILARETHLPVARIRLHEVFVTQNGYREREIIQFLEKYWQKDILALLASRQMVIDQSNPAKLVATLFQLLLVDTNRSKQKELWEMAVSSPFFIRYLTTEADGSLLTKLVEQRGIGWGKDTIGFMNAVSELFDTAITHQLEREKLKILFLQFNLLFLSGKLTIKHSEDYLEAFFAYLRQVTHTIPVSVFVLLLKNIEKKGIAVTNLLSGSAAVLQKHISTLVHHLDGSASQKKEWEQENRLADAANKQEQERKRLQQQAIREELERQRLSEEERLRKEAEKIQEDKRNKIYIRNSGIVLFHPFLGTYFSRLGLLAEGKFIDETSQHRAVLLLQYLVNGRTEADEFELPLNKILCGLSVEQVVPVAIELTEIEITVSEELFQVIFQRWEKMKNTTVAGFRASFLQREGALSRGEENWELVVEQRSYDMLLDTLPWAFGMIKNTWMNQILTVQWT